MSDAAAPPVKKPGSGPPARLLARLGAPGAGVAPAIDPSTIPPPSDAEVLAWLASTYSWQCCVCCERQPVSHPGGSMLAFAAAALRRSAYAKACQEARQRPTQPPPLPTPLPPPVDEETLGRQVCRDCGCAGMKLTAGGAVEPQAVNYALLRQLVAASVRVEGGGTAESAASPSLAAADEYLRAKGLDGPEAVRAALDADGPPWPAASPPPLGAAAALAAARGGLSSPSPSPTGAGALGARPLPVSLGYAHAMLLHDTPLAYPDERTPEEAAAAAEAAAEEAALAGAGHIPSPPPYPEIHPERPDRLRAAAGYLVATGLWGQFHRAESRRATDEEVALACEPAHLDEVRAVIARVEKEDRERAADAHAASAAAHAVDPPADGASSPSAPRRSARGAVRLGDTYFSASTLDAALLALGTTVEVAESVASGRAGRGLALVRPPGHHADCSHSQGFCIFNNVGGSARAVLRRHPETVRRVLILDWDVHHGDGTEQMFYEDDRVLYISLHRHDAGAFYPGSGASGRVGQGKGEGFNVNVPLDGQWYGDADYLALFDHVVMPIARAFAPDLVFISSGFDAARGDWIGDFDVTPAGYAQMTHLLASLAGGRVVVALEGGYNLHAVAASTAAVARVLLGEAPIPLDAYAGVPNRVADAARAEEEEEGGGADGAAAAARRALSQSSRSAHPLVPQEGTWRAIEETVRVHGRYWPCLLRGRGADAHVGEGEGDAAALRKALKGARID
jgi:acetoin utilization deacetylase AcuC-like enzyme